MKLPAPPARIVDISKRMDPDTVARRAERQDWALAQDMAGHPRSDIAAALGIHLFTLHRILRRAYLALGPKKDPPPQKPPEQPSHIRKAIIWQARRETGVGEYRRGAEVSVVREPWEGPSRAVALPGDTPSAARIAAADPTGRAEMVKQAIRELM